MAARLLLAAADELRHVRSMEAAAMHKAAIKHLTQPTGARLITAHSGRSGWRGIHFQEVEVAAYGTFETQTSQLRVSMTRGPMRVSQRRDGTGFADHPTDPLLALPGFSGVGAWRGKQRGLHLHIDPSTVERITGRDFQSRAFSFIQGPRKPIKNLLQALYIDVVSDHPTGPALGEAIVSSIVQQLIEEGGVVQQPGNFETFTNANFQRLRDWIDANLDHPITLDDMADQLGISVRHLCRTFKATTGYPPHRYILLRRVEHAKLLIQAGHLSLQEVALAAGFAHQAHMTDTFRKLVGISPLHFRHKL